MDFWISFWYVTLVVSMAIFAALAVVVTIRGFGDVLALFRTISARHAGEDTGGDQREQDVQRDSQ